MGIRRHLAPVLVALMMPSGALADPVIMGGPEFFALTSTSTRLVTATERDIDAKSKIWQAVADRRLHKLRKSRRDLDEMTINRNSWRWLARQPAPEPAWVWPVVAASGTLGIAIGVILAVLAGG